MTEAASTRVEKRSYPAAHALQLSKEGVAPLLARILAGRGVDTTTELTGPLTSLIHYQNLKGAVEGATFLADAIAAGKQLLVVADYDCDGATACSVAMRGLRAFGANINYIVPDRMVHGYGLTPSVVALAKERFPSTEILVTVDNGVSSHAGVNAAVELGMDVLVTDHHLPSKDKPLPPAKVIIDPSQQDCTFPSKALAGVGVIWYVLWALQDELRKRSMPIAPGFKVSSLLPLVAVGTVADVVPLDRNNRILVQAGLDRIRNNDNVPPGVLALATVGVINRTDTKQLLTSDIAFGIGPRINAAGRLETMDIGIECLITDDAALADNLAELLDNINQKRKDVEFGTVIEAVEQAEKQVIDGTRSIAVHSDDWHAGVIGIVAGRIKERRYRPTFVLTTDSKTGEIKGSGRSIPGFNLKDALDQVDKSCPGLLIKFGGHAMAAGVTLRPGGFESFKSAFEAEANRCLTPDILLQRIEHDGELTGQELSVDTTRVLSAPPWGQMFPEPVFCNTFRVVDALITGAHGDQLNMIVELDGVEMKATRFRHEGPRPTGAVKLIYKLQKHRTPKGKEELKLLIDQIV